MHSDSFSSSLSIVDNVVNAWSVNGATLSSADIASNLFAFSLFPYLAFLYFLSKAETKTPKTANFGFQFLLVFVFATIPAGIISKVQYHDILANVDWLHGLAESFLSITNLLIIYGFRQPRQQFGVMSDNPSNSQPIGRWDAELMTIGAFLAIYSLHLTSYPEPSNALSFHTWLVHSSSIFEWLLAMRLVWEQATVSGNPRWKGLTLAMLPSQASGLCACTYHFFFNSPEVIWLVALQAALTVAGNTSLALATYRIFSFQNQRQQQQQQQGQQVISGESLLLDNSDVELYSSLLIKALLGAAIVKYGEVYLPQPFAPDASLALAMVFLPTIANAVNYANRGRREEKEERQQPSKF